MVALTEPLTPGALRPLTPTTSGFIVEEGLVVLVRRGMGTVGTTDDQSQDDRRDTQWSVTCANQQPRHTAQKTDGRRLGARLHTVKDAQNTYRFHPSSPLA